MAALADRQRRLREKAKRAVVKVGDGRGFVVSAERERFVVTAAHCLPRMPPAHPGSYTDERTYKKLLGPLGREPTVWAECLFVDPVADIAVLGSPDGQALYEEAEAYEALTGAAVALPVADLPGEAAAWVLALDGRWFRCVARHNGGGIWLFKSPQPIEAGMSGSPIIASDGSAIGIVSVSGRRQTDDRVGDGPEPRLAANLPGWILQRFIKPPA